MMTSKLALEIRRVNHANGFGLEPKLTDIPRSIALIHSEISEAWDDRNAPSKLRHEIGDVIIRCLDLIVCIRDAVRAPDVQNGTPDVDISMEVPLDDLPDTPWPKQVLVRYSVPPGITSHSIAVMHSLATEALQTYRKAPDLDMPQMVVNNLWILTAYCVDFLQSLAMRGSAHVGTVESLVLDILDANRKRSYRHGNRRI